jgi:uncharacterized protein with PQ loop repeat
MAAPASGCWNEPRFVERSEYGPTKKMTLAILGVCCLFAVSGCDDLIPQDTASLFAPRFQRSELVGLLAGFGTTFAAVPDLVSMLRKRSSAGMNPRMAAIMGVFQILWVYYGLLIVSRPVVAWNLIAVLTNFFSVGAYLHFVRKESAESQKTKGSATDSK